MKRKLTEEVEFIWIELCELGDFPAASSHDGLHHGGDLLESLEGLLGSRKVRQVAVAVDQGVVFWHLDDRVV